MYSSINLIITMVALVDIIDAQALNSGSSPEHEAQVRQGMRFALGPQQRSAAERAAAPARVQRWTDTEF